MAGETSVVGRLVEPDTEKQQNMGTHELTKKEGMLRQANTKHMGRNRGERNTSSVEIQVDNTLRNCNQEGRVLKVVEQLEAIAGKEPQVESTYELTVRKSEKRTRDESSGASRTVGEYYGSPKGTASGHSKLRQREEGDTMQEDQVPFNLNNNGQLFTAHKANSHAPMESEERNNKAGSTKLGDRGPTEGEPTGAETELMELEVYVNNSSGVVAEIEEHTMVEVADDFLLD